MIRTLSTTVKLVALLVLVVAGLLFSGPGLRSDPQSAEAAALSEVQKLLASDAQAGDRLGFSVAISGDTAVVGAWQEDAAGTDAGAVYVFQRNEGGAGNWGEVAKLTASDAQANDLFGTSVAVSSNTAVVGARGKDGGAGAVYVFQRNQGGTDNWGEVKKLAASNAGDQFGFSVAISNNTVVVGAISADVGGNNTGAAYFYQRDEGGTDNWGAVKMLTASDAAADEVFDEKTFGVGLAFGLSVAINDSVAVIGASGADAGIINTGAAYVYHRDEGGTNNWGEVKKLIASDAEVHDRFGHNVAVSGDTAVVGAPQKYAGATSAGAAYVFGRNEGGMDNWGEVTKLTASDGQGGDAFGIGVAVSGDTAVVGAGGKSAGAGRDLRVPA